MYRSLILCLLVTLPVMSDYPHPAIADDSQPEACPFQSSLHHTAKGMAYWYDKTNGGLETITHIPYEKLTCKNCHVSSCSTCHVDRKGRKVLYSNAAARRQSMCLKCHAREAAVKKLDHASKRPDVHFSQGMECVDCHTPRELHGDSLPYVSMKQSGAMDAKCENCHYPVTRSESHTIHKGKLDCKACHVRHVVSCANCHFDSLTKEGKRRAIMLSDWVFLMNHRNKVTSANMQTFVVRGKETFLMFAPQFSHSVMKQGRKCDACHGTDAAKQLKQGSLALTRIEKGKLVNRKAVIPIVKGATYTNAYQDFREGKWVPIEKPSQPEPHYVGFGSPLSPEQLDKMVLTPEELKRTTTQGIPLLEIQTEPKK